MFLEISISENIENAILQRSDKSLASQSVRLNKRVFGTKLEVKIIGNISDDNK